MRMKVLLIILGVILLLVGAGLAILSHPAFGLWRHVSKERIHASPNYRDGMFQNQEPDSVAHDIATKHKVNLLDAPIGTIVNC